jgi:hypothetical protein
VRSRAEKAEVGWSVPPPLPAQFYAGAIVSTLTWWLKNGLPYSPQQMGAHVKSLMINE